MQNNHFEHMDREGTHRQDKKDRYSLGKRSSVSSFRSGRNRSNRVRKKQTPREQCLSNLKTVLQCYNVFILMNHQDLYTMIPILQTSSSFRQSPTSLNTHVKIIGCGVLGIGIWLLVKEFNTREMAAIMGSRLLEMVTYGVIAGGGAATVLAFCGCCGTMKQEKFVMGFYGVVLTLVLLTLCVGFGVSFIFKEEITEGVKKRFETTIIYNYGVDIQRNSTNKLITDAWDSMQQALGCCGAHGDVNGDFSWGIYKQQSVWHKLYKPNGKIYVPDSCCVDGESRLFCQGNNDEYDGPPVFGPPNADIRTYKDNPALYTSGCYDKALVYLDQHFVIITIVTGSVPILLLIGIVLAFYLCANAKEVDDDDDFDYEVEV